MPPVSLSVLIITFNEARNIERCILSCREVADEIVVIDSQSTDQTVEIVKRLGAKVIVKPWMGYAPQKNFGHTQAQGDWIFSIDADEVLSPELAKELMQMKQQNGLVVATVNRLTNYCGRWVRHGGWFPDWKLRLYPRLSTHWEGLIHEQPIIQSHYLPAKRLKGLLFHYSYHTLSDHWLQIEKFTRLTAENDFKQGKRSHLFKLILAPAWKFFRDFFLRLGILDGKTGYLIARFSAMATFLKNARMLEWQRNQKP